MISIDGYAKLLNGEKTHLGLMVDKEVAKRKADALAEIKAAAEKKNKPERMVGLKNSKMVDDKIVSVGGSGYTFTDRVL